MASSKRNGQLIERLAAIPSLESDWVRYGVPAVVLTAVFFFAIRFEAGQPQAPSPPPGVVARKPAASRPAAFSVSKPAGGETAKLFRHNTEPGRTIVARPLAPRAAQPYGQPALTSQQQMDGRRSLCEAVQFAMANAKKSHWKRRALVMAIENYHGPGGTQVAGRAVNGALQDYTRGAWNESQCTPLPGAPPLARGAIAEAMR